MILHPSRSGVVIYAEWHYEEYACRGIHVRRLADGVHESVFLGPIREILVLPLGRMAYSWHEKQIVV